MGGAPSTHRRDEKFIQNLKVRHNLGDLSVDMVIILKFI
jgi:hypothetical protein